METVRAKKPFLKRGEGTERRVFASRYREEAKKKRETNFINAEVREKLRIERGVEESPPLALLPAEQSEVAEETGPEENIALVDGNCTVVAEEKSNGEAGWLENQRRHEEERWMELKEFEELEKQIAEETQKKLENAEEKLNGHGPVKRVTFREGSEKIPPMTKGEKAKGQKGVEKLKNMTSNRGAKSKSITTRVPQKSRIPKKSPRPTPKQYPFLESTTPLAGLDAEGNLTVDSTFLDRILDKDFQSKRSAAGQKTENPELSERLSLQALREEFETEKRVWEDKQRRIESEFESMKNEELKKIKRERRVLEQQSKAILKLPSKKERSEIESLEAVIETERKEARAREARHKLSIDRLKDQIRQLQTETKELQDEVKWYEEMQLRKEETKNATTSPSALVDQGTQTDLTRLSSPVNENMVYVDEKDRWAVRLENPFYSESSQGSQPKLDPTGELPLGDSFQSNGYLQNPSTERFPAHTDPCFFKPEMSATFDQGKHAACFGHDSVPGWQSWSVSDSYPAASQFYDRPYIPEISHPPYRPPRILTPPQPSIAHSLPPYQRDAFLQTNYPQFMPTNEDIHRADVSWYPQIAQTARPNWHPAKTQVRNPFDSHLPVDDYSTHPLLSLRPDASFANIPSYSNSFPANSFSVTDKIDIESQVQTKSQPATETIRSVASTAKQTSKRCPRVIQDTRSVKLFETVNQAKDEELPEMANFPNGTVKQSYSDGRVVLWFSNSDVKHVHPCGRVEYFYSGLHTWQVTHDSGIEVFYFDIGQIEAHKPNGEKEILFPDGSLRRVLVDGNEMEVSIEEVVAEIKLPKPEVPGNRPERKNRKKLAGSK